jgi:bacteriophage exclusion system BrxC/D-like protein
MLDALEAKKVLVRLSAGLPPPARLAPDFLVGHERLLAEWLADLDQYVTLGGSLLRIVVGPTGNGKTHLGEAVKAIAAQRGFLVCQIDAQAQRTSGDDLSLYRAFCQGLTLPAEYLCGGTAQGLLPVIEHIAETLDGKAVRRALAKAALPIPALADALAALVDAVRDGRIGAGAPAADRGWELMASLLQGEQLLAGPSPCALRARHPAPFRHLRRAPAKRDARLWLESLLRAFRPLGFPGALMVLDEHDETRKKALDGSIAQLRRQLDRLAEGNLPGAFVLYLVLDDFPERVREGHVALEQRIAPLLDRKLPSRLMTHLRDLRDMDGPAFLEAVAERVHLLVRARPLPASLAGEVHALAAGFDKLSGPDTRGFIQAFSQLIAQT